MLQVEIRVEGCLDERWSEWLDGLAIAQLGGERFEPRQLESLQMGCVSFARKYFRDGRIDGSPPAKNVARGITFCPQGNRVFDELSGFRRNPGLHDARSHRGHLGT